MGFVGLGKKCWLKPRSACCYVQDVMLKLNTELLFGPEAEIEERSPVKRMVESASLSGAS